MEKNGQTFLGDNHICAYIEFCFFRCSFLKGLEKFLIFDSNLADNILKNHRETLLDMKHIPNKRKKALRTKNLDFRKLELI